MSESDIPNSHTPLPEGKYRFGEESEYGVRPVFGAFDQLLWYSVPGLTTRFTSWKEAEFVASHRPIDLTFESFCKLIGAAPHHNIARQIWDTLKDHGYQITRRKL